MGPPLEEEEVEVEVVEAVVVAVVAIAPCFILSFSAAPLLYIAPSLSSLEATIREVSPSLKSPRALSSRERERERPFFLLFSLSTAKEESSATATATTTTKL